MSKTMKRALLLVALGVAAPAAALGEEIDVWRSPFCGCCHLWMKHMESAGFTVRSNETDDLMAVKRERKVPPDLASCHTAVVAGYTIEGHVPAADVQKLLADRPDALGLVLPGMPAGSPGMGIGAEPYDVLLLQKDGSTKIFAHHAGTT
ncbi:MAG: DUF411 domain-containing protein [Hyphomicrobiales bacterium]|nr:DUF411 domain-containing protein [Hyphomicrobiales bacterium]